jgi:hypothetical protein
MRFHGFHECGGQHFMTITDHGKRQVLEVTPEERHRIGCGRERAYRMALRDALQGIWAYSPPFRDGIFGEAWMRGRMDGQRGWGHG